MALIGINCPACKKPHMWFSGNRDQRCSECSSTPARQPNARWTELADDIIASYECDQGDNHSGMLNRLRSSILDAFAEVASDTNSAGNAALLETLDAIVEKYSKAADSYMELASKYSDLATKYSDLMAKNIALRSIANRHLE